jgi:hypothetical protein
MRWLSLAFLLLSPLDADNRVTVPIVVQEGFPFFQAFNPEIDYPQRRLFLSGAPPATSDGPIPLEVVDKSCLVRATVTLRPGAAPIPLTLVVDTGYDGNLVLNTPFVEKHRLLSGSFSRAGGSALGGVTGGPMTRLPALGVGGQVMHDLEVRLSTDAEGVFSSAEVDGYLGGGFLQHYSVHFDYANSMLRLSR